MTEQWIHTFCQVGNQSGGNPYILLGVLQLLWILYRGYARNIPTSRVFNPGGSLPLPDQVLAQCLGINRQIYKDSTNCSYDFLQKTKISPRIFDPPPWEKLARTLHYNPFKVRLSDETKSNVDHEWLLLICSLKEGHRPSRVLGADSVFPLTEATLSNFQ